ncbi:MAG: DNRLRE domain-containing protein [Ginsengibacter sp.]
MKSYTFTTILILSYLFPVTSNALTYYISPSGNDSNAGTSLIVPWQTISRINAQDFTGDTILFQGGNTFTGNLYFTPSDIGTPSLPIVIGSYGTGSAIISSGTNFGIYIENSAGYVIKNLIFAGSGIATNTSSGILLYMDKDSILLPYLKIDSVEVYGYHDRGIIFGSSKNLGGYSDVSITNSVIHDNGRVGITAYGVLAAVHKNVYVGYNKVYNISGISTDTSGNSGSGIVLANVDGGIIEYCTAYNNGALHKNTNGGPNAMWAYLSNDIVIQYNEAHHNKTGSIKDGGGFDLDGGCSNSVMQYNYSHDNDGGGYLVAAPPGVPLMQNLIVRYNISENDGRKNGYASFHLWAASTSNGIKNIQIYNNSVYITPSGTTSPAALVIKSGVFTGCTVRNNIFQTKGGVQIIIATSAASNAGFTFQGNNYYSTGGAFKINWAGVVYTSLSAWRTAKSQEKINGIASGFQLDPEYSDTTTGVTFGDATQLTALMGYKLKNTSALIIRGLNLPEIFGTSIGAIDFWRNSIANKPVFNIGAYQLNTTATLTTAADSYVRNGAYATKNYGTDTSLIVKTDTSTVGNTLNSYLKFNLTGVTDVVSAKLRVYGRNTTGTTSPNISIYGVNTDSWTETGLTWNNAPAAGSFLFSTGVGTQARYYEFDVTGFVQAQFAGDKVVSFLIKDTTKKKLRLLFNSKENRNLQSRPQLIIATTALTSPRPAIVLNNQAENPVGLRQPDELSFSAKAYPNPVQKRFTVELKNKYGGDFHLQMQDEIGRLYDLGKRSLTAGQSKINLDVSNLYLKPGVYILKVVFNKAKPAIIKLVMQ